MAPLVRFERRGGGFVRLAIDFHKIERIIEREGGADIFGGGCAKWETVWPCQEELEGRDVDSGLPKKIDFSSRQGGGCLTEIFNYENLEAKLKSGDLADAEYAKSILAKSTRRKILGQLQVAFY